MSVDVRLSTEQIKSLIFAADVAEANGRDVHISPDGVRRIIDAYYAITQQGLLTNDQISRLAADIWHGEKLSEQIIAMKIQNALAKAVLIT